MGVEDLKFAVIGAGTMGSGIALVCALNGYEVCLMDIKERLIKDAFTKIGSNLETLHGLGAIGKEDIGATMGRIRGASKLLEAIKEADFVIEAVPEAMALKKQVFREIDESCPEHSILASNTSTLRISEIAESTKRPSKVIGTHWMNPPYIFPLVEVIRGAKTSEDTLDLTISLLKKMRKEPVVCKDVPGFIVNRLQFAMSVEALNLLEQGIASKEDIDKAWTRHLGIRYALMGPLEALDHLGLDVVLNCQEYLFEELKETKFQPPEILKRKVESGELGLKSGKGFYNYPAIRIDEIARNRDRRITDLLRKLKII